MKYKKTILTILIIACILFSISAVMASDVNETVIANEDEQQTIQETNEEFVTTPNDYTLKTDEGTSTETYDSENESDIKEDDYPNTITPNFNIGVPNKIYEGTKVTITFTSSDNVNGTIHFIDLYGESKKFEIKNGKGSINIKIPSVKKIYYKFYSNDKNVNNVENSFKINVVKATIKANNFKVDYPSKTKYQVRILDNNGASIGAGKIVTFYLYTSDGEKIATKTAKTDAKGYAKVYFDVAPTYFKFEFDTQSDYYKIKIKYGSATVTKKYTVKAVKIVPKKFTKNKKLYRDYGGNLHGFNKKISLSFVLKKASGSYLKGATVKFKFKGKTYSAKTNKKGSVSFTLNKKYLITILQGKGPNQGQNFFKISYKKQNVYGMFEYFTNKLPGWKSSPYKYYICMNDLSKYPLFVKEE